MGTGDLVILKASKNNLNDIDVRLKHNAITTVVGVSGSGKSSLIVGTIAAEAQRQLNETYPIHVQLRLPRPAESKIGAAFNLSPTVLIDQQQLGGGSRSTVGTITPAYGLLRLLFSRAGVPSAGETTAYSFNDPRGMCTACDGLGEKRTIDVAELLDEEKSLNDGAITFSSFRPGTFRWKRYVTSGLFDPELPIKSYSPSQRNLLLYETGITPLHPRDGWPKSATFEGVVPRLTRSYLRRSVENETQQIRHDINRIAPRTVCTVCNGDRINEAARASLIRGESIADWSRLETAELETRVKRFRGTEFHQLSQLLEAQLTSMQKLGIGYLSMDRRTDTLSGGESQRVKLIKHLGSSLTGMTYVFDEPSRGLHPADVGSLRELLVDISRKGNTVLVVEHDPSFLEISDSVLEIGPGAGRNGGNVVYSGPRADFLDSATVTAAALRQCERVKSRQRKATGIVELRHITRNNIIDLNVDVPLGVVVAISGVAGAGKTSLMSALVETASESVALMSQRSSHKSKRMSVGSFLALLDPIRDQFASFFGVPPGVFSANSIGACPECRGIGKITVDMAFMENIESECPVCTGQRFRTDTLHLKRNGLNIADVLNLALSDILADQTFETDRSVLTAAVSLGLGYLKVGQPMTEISGGEMVRLKLAKSADTDATVIILDEPSSGLHSSDVDQLARYVHATVDSGKSLILLEHNMRLVAEADWVIDMGPGGGSAGGRVVATGLPSDIVRHPESVTAQYLAEWVR